MSEPAFRAIGSMKIIDKFPINPLYRQEHKLCNARTHLDLERFL